MGFEFASLHAPEGADLTKQTSIRRPNEEPISERFDKLGYYSPLLLVQQQAFFLLIAMIGFISLCLKACKKSDKLNRCASKTETFIPVILFRFLGIFFAPTIVAALSNVESFTASDYPFGLLSVTTSFLILGCSFTFLINLSRRLFNARVTMEDEEFYEKQSK